MTYQETINYLFDCTPMFQNIGGQAYKEGLHNTHVLDEYFGHRHREYRTIHLAGTNGKGSCSHTMAAVLQSSGQFSKVGLYTSPHLLDFRERFRVNGKPMPESFVIDFVQKHRDVFEPLHPSFFELTTAMGFLFFAEMGVEAAVIEVGLGGRLDCTNIINPDLSIITNIGFDHTQFLGNTLAAIASEKAGIIKTNVPVVIGERGEDTDRVFLQKATEVEAPIIFAEDIAEVMAYHYNSRSIHYDTRSWGSFSGSLCGEYQIKNTNTVLTALNILVKKGYEITPKIVSVAFDGVSEITGLRGRWQIVRKSPLVVCDTGHNVEAFRYLSHQIRKLSADYDKLHIVFGMVDDKDADGVLSLLPREAQYYFTAPTNKRAVPTATMAAKAASHGLQGDVYANVKVAYEAALLRATSRDFIFVGGSSYLVADFLTATRLL